MSSRVVRTMDKALYDNRLQGFSIYSTLYLIPIYICFWLFCHRLRDFGQRILKFDSIQTTDVWL